MRLADEIALRPAADRGAVPHSELVIAGRPTGQAVPGKATGAHIHIGPMSTRLVPGG